MKSIISQGLCALLLAGCVGGNSGDRAKSDTDIATDDDVLRAVSTAPLSVRQEMFNYIEDEYLWYQDLPSVDLTVDTYADLRNLLEDLRKVPEDRFSYLANAVSQAQRFQLGVSGTFGFRYSVRGEDPLDIRIISVDDLGTVAQAGIQRGDRIMVIDGQSVEAMSADEFSQFLFADTSLGVQHTLLVRHPDGSEGEYQITRTEHLLSPIRRQQVFTSPASGRRVGYVQVEEFIGRTAELMPQMRAGFVSEALDDLILDLRYNGGGFVSVSRDLASSFYGESQPSNVYTVLQYNDKNRGNDITFPYLQFDNALTGLQRIFVLTTASTCSASEEVINGLKPFMEVITIGATTCGKPYASTQYQLIPGLMSMNVLDARSINANGEGDFYLGLPATCEVQDDPILPFTDPQESLISAALFYTENNRCPVSADRQVLSAGARPNTSTLHGDLTAQGALISR